MVLKIIIVTFLNAIQNLFKQKNEYFKQLIVHEFKNQIKTIMCSKVVMNVLNVNIIQLNTTISNTFLTVIIYSSIFLSHSTNVAL